MSCERLRGGDLYLIQGATDLQDLVVWFGGGSKDNFSSKATHADGKGISLVAQLQNCSFSEVAQRMDAASLARKQLQGPLEYRAPGMTECGSLR